MKENNFGSPNKLGLMIPLFFDSSYVFLPRYRFMITSLTDESSSISSLSS